MTLLSHVFSTAVRWQWCERNPVSAAGKPKVQNRRVRYLRDDERERLSWRWHPTSRLPKLCTLAGTSRSGVVPTISTRCVGVASPSAASATSGGNPSAAAHAEASAYFKGRARRTREITVSGNQ